MTKRNFLNWGLITLALVGIAIVAYSLLPKISADTITRTITVSGKVTDIAQVPIAGARIAMKPNGGNTVSAYSSNNGNYTLRLIINTGMPEQDTILARVYSPGRILKIDQFTIDSANTINSNFVLAVMPQDRPSTKVLDPVSARCRIKSSPQAYDTWQHLGDYTGKVVNGELFCTASNPQLFTTYATQIDAASKQIKALSIRTGLNYIPPIYLTGDITWHTVTGAKAYTSPGREIVIGVNELNLSYITHEYGHLVDWYKGWDELPARSNCDVNIAGTKAHCYSSADKSFISASSIARQQIINGYATTDRGEMFAEIFDAQELPESAATSNFQRRTGLKMDLINAPLLIGVDDFTDVSHIRLPTTVSQQYAAIYIYKFVASKSGLDQFFPGTIGSWGYNDILSGKYLNLTKPPTVTLQSATNVAPSSATLNGISVGSITNRGFFYGIDRSGNGSCSHLVISAMTNWATSSSGTGSFSANITGLAPNTYYCVTAYALPYAKGKISFKTLALTSPSPAPSSLDPCNIAPQITALSPPSLTVGASNPSPVITTSYKITSMAPAGCTQRIQLSETMDTSKFPSNLKLTSTVIKSGSQSGSPIDISLLAGASDYATATILLTNNTQPTTALPFGPLTPVVFKAQIYTSP